MNEAELVLGILALIIGGILLPRGLSDHRTARLVGSLLVVAGLYFPIIGVLQPP